MAEKKGAAPKAAPSSTDKGASASDPTASPAPDAGKESTSTAAAPIEAPHMTQQVLGNPRTSTDFVAANAALRSVPGANHLELLDEDGNAVDPETVFEFPAAESPSMLATVTQRVYQRFTHHGASTPTTQLLYPAGAQVPIGDALRARDGLRRDAHGKTLEQ